MLADSTDSGGECGVIYDKRMGLGMPIIKGPLASPTLRTPAPPVPYPMIAHLSVGEKVALLSIGSLCLLWHCARLQCSGSTRYVAAPQLGMVTYHRLGGIAPTHASLAWAALCNLARSTVYSITVAGVNTIIYPTSALKSSRFRQLRPCNRACAGREYYSFQHGPIHFLQFNTEINFDKVPYLGTLPFSCAGLQAAASCEPFCTRITAIARTRASVTSSATAALSGILLVN